MLDLPDIEPVVAPEPLVTLDQIRAHLNLSADQTYQDNYLLSLISPAMEVIESVAEVATTQRTLRATYRIRNGYSTSAEVEIPVYPPPVVVLNSVIYRYPSPEDSRDVTDVFSVLSGGGRGRSGLIGAAAMDATAITPDSIVIEYITGYIVSVNIPQVFIVACLQLISDWSTWRGSAEELRDSRLARNLPGSWQSTLRNAGFDVPTI